MHMVSIVFQRKTCLYISYMYKNITFLKQVANKLKRKRKERREAAVLKIWKIFIEIVLSKFVPIYLF